MGKELKILLQDDFSKDPVYNIDKENILAMISHKENNLSSSEPCSLVLELGNKNKIIETREVFPYNVFPNLIKDDTKNINRGYGWDAKKKKWAKIAVVEKKGEYVLRIDGCVLDDILLELKDINKKLEK